MFEYRLQTRVERLGALELQLQCLESLDRTIDALFEYLQKSGQESLLETWCPYFGVIWPSARALCGHLAEKGPAVFTDRSVLEVGCGLALPSLLLSKLGACVTATDFHPEVPRFLERNIALNGLSGPHYVALDWATGAEALREARYDWIVGSDLLYERQQPEFLARVIEDHLAPGGRAVLADPARPYLQPFVDAMRVRGFVQETRVRTAPDGAGTKDVFIVEFWKG
ncbi:MAG: protein N-lysine methyltransferase family protein [Oligoflexia bacterium]|nr:protein N-lysine methyltransferase family protein [Oligoflexia bacterium]